MKGSEVKYLESDKEYSFHSWAKRSFEAARLAWFTTKYPVYSGQCVNKFLGSISVTRQAWVYTFKEAVERAAFTLALARKYRPRAKNVVEELTEDKPSEKELVSPFQLGVEARREP